MQISPNSFNKLSFGMISQDAVDSIRRYSEGFDTVRDYRKNSKDGYRLNPEFSKFTKEQLIRLKNLVKRASMLRKTIIGSTPESFSSYSIKPQDGITVFAKDEALDMDFSFKNAKGNNDRVLDLVEGAVDYAEKIEKNEQIDSFKRVNCDIEEYGSVFYSPLRIIDNNRTKEENDTLQYIYDLSLNVCKDRFYGNTF